MPSTKGTSESGAGNRPPCGLWGCVWGAWPWRAAVGESTGPGEGPARREAAGGSALRGREGRWGMGWGMGDGGGDGDQENRGPKKWGVMCASSRQLTATSFNETK